MIDAQHNCQSVTALSYLINHLLTDTGCIPNSFDTLQGK